MVLILLAGAGIYYGIFVWKNFSGAVPAFSPPPEDIAKTENTTGFPLAIEKGFSVSIFASSLGGGARVLTRDDRGALLASITAEGKIVALPDENHDGKADRVVTVADHLNKPHGLAFDCNPSCVLYIAEQHRVSRFVYDSSLKKATLEKKIIDLPSRGGHFTRTLLFTEINGTKKLLTSIGSSCNVCRESDWRRAKVLVSDPDGGNLKIFASGLRNAVFITLHPETKKVWVTEMGRDYLGDNTPPDEINILEEGKDYGWPICYGKNIHDMGFDKNTYVRNPCGEPDHVPSYIDLQAHSAPLGLAFIPKEGWPKEYQGNLLVAFHGSWNRSVPTGYKIVRFVLNDDGSVKESHDFLTGWLKNSGALGRPVDIRAEKNGELFVSDDKAGVIYRIWRPR